MQGRKRRGNWVDRRTQPKKKKEEDGADEEELIYDTAIVKENKLLEQYYKTQFEGLISEAEFATLLATMREPLPITFRISPTKLRSSVLRNMFCSPDWLKKLSAACVYLVTPQEAEKQEKEGVHTKEEPTGLTEEEIKSLTIKCWDFYPGKVLFELALSRHQLKRSEGAMHRIHKFVQSCTDAGLINRQEVVSMLPPLILDVKPGMKVLDMCAAPGSKTSQLLEKCFGDYTQHHDLRSEVTKTGIVVANDSDFSRAFMLTHQLQRFDTASLLVLNHDGQNFPTLYRSKNETAGAGYDARYLFDRVLCDVPCSSDAAIRKIPMKWKEWGTGKAFGLHPLQLKLLCRALQLTKVGGKVCYSTCSMNPIEDEAVVNAVFEIYGEAIELVDVAETLKGFKYRKGLGHWHVMAENKTHDGFTEFKNFAEVPKELHGKVRETMFCADFKALVEKRNIERCVRVMPHDQNTGGFFMAIFRKVAELGSKKGAEEEKARPEVAVAPKKAEEEKKAPAPEKPVVAVQKKFRVGQFERVEERDPETEYIRVFFGLEGFPMHLLYTINGNMKTVILVTEAVNEFLELVAKQQEQKPKGKEKESITNMGVKCFERCKSQYKGSACLFRIQQAGAKYLLPYMKKRVVKCNMETIKMVLTRNYVGIAEIPDEVAKKAIMELSIGAFLLYVEVEDPDNPGKIATEPLAAHRSDEKINVLANKEEVISFRLRHFL